MTRETVQFRANRVFNSLESLAVRLEVVVGYWERKTAADLAKAEDAPAEPPEPDAEAVKEAEQERLKEEEMQALMEGRLFEAERLAERVRSGEITEEEKEEYMQRWFQK